MSYSNKTHVILIKGEVRTMDVSLVKPNEEATNTYFVYFRREQEPGKRRLYQYSLKEVEIMEKPWVLNPLKYELTYQGSKLKNIYCICCFKSADQTYWTIAFRDSREDIVCQEKELKIRRKSPRVKKLTDKVEYLTDMAYLHGYELRGGEDKVVLLGDQYGTLRRGNLAPLLEAYLNPAGFRLQTDPICSTPIFPFCSNSSQFQAVSRALSHRLSVIQGPPGTGKTETILNILINLVLAGKSTMVVAGSNSATENILEKLQEEGLDFLVAKLGNKANKEKFLANQKETGFCPDEWASSGFDREAAVLRLSQLTQKLQELYEMDVDLHLAIENNDDKAVKRFRAALAEADYNKKRNEMRSLSWAIVKYDLYERFGGSHKRGTYDMDDIEEGSTRFDQFLQDYPIVLSTAFSASKCVADTSAFDYLIMDEASQVDVATGALALSVARNAVIVGDVKQLPNVIKPAMKVVSRKVFEFFDIPEPYDYSSNNFLQSICGVFTGVPETLLREHYRCHPKIVRFFNHEFYEGRLVAMTEDHGEKDVLVLRTTVPGYHASDFTNHREEEEIEDLMNDLDLDVNSADVGIIVPYNNQKRRIKEDDDIEDDIQVDTVHKYQGRQSDVIIISTVDNKYSSFVNDPNLFNVAVSRPKRQLILVTNGNNDNTGTALHLAEYIRESGGRCETGQVKSRFDLIYPQYELARKEYTESHPAIPSDSYSPKDPPSAAEEVAFGFITDVLKGFPELAVKFRYPMRKLIRDQSKLESEEQRAYVSNLDTHIDFLLVSRSTGDPFCALEIDGSSYHVEGSFQDIRDKMKDHILDIYCIPHKRFKTKESVNEENELRQFILNQQTEQVS